jgi:tRNA pseudouridine38-40 synthase
MVRTLEDIRIDGDLDKLEIYLTADGFLHNMARKIIGLLVDIGSGQRPVTDAKKCLIQKIEHFHHLLHQHRVYV